MRDLAVLLLHLLVTVARLAGPGGARSVVAEPVLVKHQLLILNRSRKRSSNLLPFDRVVAGLCAVFIRPGRLIRSAIVFKPSTLLSLIMFRFLADLTIKPRARRNSATRRAAYGAARDWSLGSPARPR